MSKEKCVAIRVEFEDGVVLESIDAKHAEDIWERITNHFEVHRIKHVSRVPVRLDQIIQGEEDPMADITKNVGSTVNSVPIELNAEGQTIPGLPVAANVKYSIDNPAVGTLTQNADGSASVLGIAAGVCNLSWIDTSNPNLAASVKQLQFSADTTPVSLGQTLS